MVKEEDAWVNAQRSARDGRSPKVGSGVQEGRSKSVNWLRPIYPHPWTVRTMRALTLFSQFLPNRRCPTCRLHDEESLFGGGDGNRAGE